MADILSRLRLRRDTSAGASAANPTLADGEAMYTKDNNVLKIGDGVTPWNVLPQIGTALLGRINTWTQANIFTDDVTIIGDDSLFQGSNQESESYYSTAGDKLITKAKTAATWWSQRFSNFEITNFDNTKSFIRGIVNAQVELFYNGVKKLETLVGGVKVTGDVSADTASGNWIAALADVVTGTSLLKLITPKILKDYADTLVVYSLASGAGYIGIRLSNTQRFYLQWQSYSLASPGGSSQAVSWPLVFPTALVDAWVQTFFASSQMIGTQSNSVTGTAVCKGSSDVGVRSGRVFAIGW